MNKPKQKSKEFNEKFSKVGKKANIKVMHPCAKCGGTHRNIECKPRTPKEDDSRVYTHEVRCPDTKETFLVDLTNDYR